MPRNMSFFHTTPQVRDKTKTVTRRDGWWHLVPGQRFWAIVKGQGLKKGERVEKICLLECVSNRRERLDAILGYPADETAREGFPHMTPQQFIEMFCRNMNVAPGTMINRIEFKYVEENDGHEANSHRGAKSRRALPRPVHHPRREPLSSLA